MYEGYKISKPYKRKDGRYIVSVKTPEGKKTSISYPKYVMECHLGRYLTDKETVDHDNGYFSDNRIENFKILTRVDNAKKAAVRVEIPIACCSWCGVSFTPTRAQYEKRASAKAGPFCGKSCAGKYGASVQNGGSALQREPIDVKYYHFNESYIKKYV